MAELNDRPAGATVAATTHMTATLLTELATMVETKFPIPVPGPGQVQVKVAVVGVCGSDVHYYEHGRIGDFVVMAPLVLGHEVSGVVTEVGEGVDAARMGDRVAIEPQAPCRHCRECKAGRYNLCPRIRFYATPPVDGAFAEYVLIDDDFAHRIPDTMSMEEAALCEPLSVAVWSTDKAGVTVGSSVLIAGAGMIGAVTTQVALARGATEVIVADPVAERREVVSRLGATRVIDPRDTAAMGALSVDSFIDAAGAPSAIHTGIAAVRPSGRVVLIGMGADSLELPVALIQARELVLTGVFRYANTWPAAIALVEHGRVNLADLVTARFPMSRAEEALLTSKRPDQIKVVVGPDY